MKLLPLFLLNQHTREITSVQKTSHKHNNKDLSYLRYLSPVTRVNTKYINSTRVTSSKMYKEVHALFTSF